VLTFEQQVSCDDSKLPVFELKVRVHEELKTVHVTEASMINTCTTKFKHLFDGNSLIVLQNDVNLATLDQQATLADVNMNETTELLVKAHTTDDDSCSTFDLNVKTLTGKVITLTEANSNW
jgi:hypothetical protein